MAVSSKSDWEVQYKDMTAEGIRHSFKNNREYILAKDQYTATEYDRFMALAYAVRDRLVERWITTQQAYHRNNLKRVYYLSMEFLIGRLLENNICNLGMDKACAEAMESLGLNLEDVCTQEIEAGLGNGGLGRLAACFLDSMATLGIPAHGYGIRYEFGIFNQRIVNGEQVEFPDEWLRLTNPWEFERPEYIFTIKFGGRSVKGRDRAGRLGYQWVDTENVLAVPFDLPVPGYQNDIVNTLRLWSARASEEFSLEEFNIGDYMGACERKTMSENVSKVLYPNDNIFEGRDLRLKQEYFLVSASLQDILRRFRSENSDLGKLPEKIAIQLNDTHPALAIPELMRILVDEEGFGWDEAWDITVQVFAYTNHTLLPEALEKWRVVRMERLLPRHLEIIYEINRRHLRRISISHPMEPEKLTRMSIIEEGSEKMVRMGHLAAVGSHSINGVAEVHSNLIKTSLLKDFYQRWPERFNNKTNGVTQRRWLLKANPPLAALIDEAIGPKWRTDLYQLRGLETHASDSEFQRLWTEARRASKLKLAQRIEAEHGTGVDPDFMFDAQVKRIHEYKRQLMFALWAVSRYLKIKDTPNAEFTPRALIFAGKAAPGYWMAKLIIQFINGVASVVNNDPQCSGKLRIFFLENYNVSLAERIIPGADLSEQISTAGMEASGTGNMKFALNGALTIGTLDGANIEIAEEVGDDNIFIFGHTIDDLKTLSSNGFDSREVIEQNQDLKRALALVRRGFFSPEEANRFTPIVDSLTAGGDPFFITADFQPYSECQARVDETLQDRERWTRMSILNVARSGKFSSDRTIQEYNREIWRAPMVRMHGRGNIEIIEPDA